MALKLASFIVDAVSSKVIGTFQVRNSTDTATHMTVNSTTGDVVIEKKLDVKGKIYSEDGTVWHSNNDGSGSGLDADLFDGVDSSYFDKTKSKVVADLNTLTSTGTYFWNVGSSNIPAPLYGNYGTLIVRARDGNNVTQIAVSKDFEFMWFRRKNNGSWNGWVTLWNSVNDGSGSGLDADKVDGVDFVNGAAGTQGVFTVKKGSTLVIPEGLYMLAVGTADTWLEINYSDSWFGGTSCSGLVLSDGVIS